MFIVQLLRGATTASLNSSLENHSLFKPIMSAICLVVLDPGLQTLYTPYAGNLVAQNTANFATSGT